jgi:energy-coupling factor transporter ATP-binding protein EcfA2
LRRNPFGELTRQERAELAVVDVQAIADQVRDDWNAVQFIGDCGRGKTTRMLALAQMLPESSYVYLPEDGPCPAIGVGRPMLVDEAQRLPRRVRKQVFAAGLPLVLATHRDLSRPLRRAGYRVTTQHIGGHNTPELIGKLLNRRIEASRLDALQTAPVVSSEDAGWLHAKFGSDIRAIESYLYDIVQSQAFVTQKVRSQEFQHGQMRFID